MTCHILNIKTRLKWQVLLMEQELLNLPKHMSLAGFVLLNLLFSVL